jgi:hypothetical protein
VAQTQMIVFLVMKIENQKVIHSVHVSLDIMKMMMEFVKNVVNLVLNVLIVLINVPFVSE